MKWFLLKQVNPSDKGLLCGHYRLDRKLAADRLGRVFAPGGSS
jgi:hypothetical protein